MNLISFKCEPDFKRLLQRLAKEKDRSVANFIKRALRIYLREHEGIEWEDGQGRPAQVKVGDQPQLRSVAEDIDPYEESDK